MSDKNESSQSLGSEIIEGLTELRDDMRQMSSIDAYVEHRDLIDAYHNCDRGTRKMVRSMVRSVRSSDIDPQSRDSLILTIMEALGLMGTESNPIS